MEKQRSGNAARDPQSDETDLAYCQKQMKRVDEKKRRLESVRRAFEETERIRSSIEKGLDDLVRHAETGEQIAGLALATVTTTAIDKLNSLAQRSPKMFLPMSRKLLYWPCVVSHKRADAKHNKQLLERLEVGKQSIYSRGEWQPKAPTNRVAMNILDLARKMERDGQLPPLTKDTKRKWFDESWNRALWAGWKPEEDARLSGIGQSKAKKKPKYCKKLHPATSQSNLRAAIKGQVGTHSTTWSLRDS